MDGKKFDDMEMGEGEEIHDTNPSRFTVQSIKDKDVFDSSLSIPTSVKFHRQISGISGVLDSMSIGQHSVTSHHTGLAAPGVLAPMLSDPGSILGSSFLLASPSYIDIYQESIDSGLGVIDEEEYDADDIFDNPEYIDTLEGRLPLAEAARMIAKDSTKHTKLFDSTHIQKAKVDCYKRVFAIGVAFFFIYSSYYGIRNAQGSLGSDKKLSLISYGALYTLMWFGGVCTNPIIHKLKPKWAMALASVGFIIYPLSQFYPTYYTLVPAAVLAGYASGLLFSVEGVYIMNTASTYALISREPLINVVGRLNGIVFSFFLGSNILGNIMGSLLLGNLYTLPNEIPELLTPANNLSSVHNLTYATSGMSENLSTYLIWSSEHNTNESAEETTVLSGCGIDFYTNPQPNRKTVFYAKRYIFFGFNTILALLGTLTIVFCLKKLKVAKPPGSGSLLTAMRDFVAIFADKRSMLMIPFMSYFGILASVILADFNAGYVACQYGADKIGYVVTLAYVFSVTGAFCSDKIIAVVGRLPVFLASFAISMSSVICMLIWSPVQGNIVPMAFVPVCLWGMADGVLYTQCNSFVSMLFRKKVALALTMYSSCIAMSALFGTLAIAYGLFSLTVKVYIVIVVNILSVICYVTLEILLKKEIL